MRVSAVPGAFSILACPFIETLIESGAATVEYRPIAILTSRSAGTEYSLRAANYPLTDDDFESGKLPPALAKCRPKLYGLTIVPEQLSRIRHERRPHGIYSTIAQCRAEVAKAEALFKAENVPYLDTTTVSSEEIASTIVRDMGLR